MVGAIGRVLLLFCDFRSTATTDGVDLSAQFIVYNNTSPIEHQLPACEANMGTAENNFYNNLWSQAAAKAFLLRIDGRQRRSGLRCSNATTGTGRAVSV
jgi:hypothetical protein